MTHKTLQEARGNIFDAQETIDNIDKLLQTIGSLDSSDYVSEMKKIELAAFNVGDVARELLRKLEEKAED